MHDMNTDSDDLLLNLHFNNLDHQVSGFDSSPSAHHFQVNQAYSGQTMQPQRVEFVGMAAGGQCRCGFSSSMGKPVSSLRCSQTCKKATDSTCGGSLDSGYTSIFGIGKFEIGGLRQNMEYEFSLSVSSANTASWYEYPERLLAKTTSRTPPGRPIRLSVLERRGGSIRIAWYV